MSRLSKENNGVLIVVIAVLILVIVLWKIQESPEDARKRGYEQGCTAIIEAYYRNQPYYKAILDSRMYEDTVLMGWVVRQFRDPHLPDPDISIEDDTIAYHAWDSLGYCVLTGVHRDKQGHPAPEICHLSLDSTDTLTMKVLLPVRNIDIAKIQIMWRVFTDTGVGNWTFSYPAFPTFDSTSKRLYRASGVFLDDNSYRDRDSIDTNDILPESLRHPKAIYAPEGLSQFKVPEYRGVPLETGLSNPKILISSNGRTWVDYPLVIYGPPLPDTILFLSDYYDL